MLLDVIRRDKTMEKVTIGVYKAYKNSGNLRFPKANTKKHWKHYFIEVDEDDEDRLLSCLDFN